MNAVIYARYSSDNQREESIEGQLRECKEYADKNAPAGRFLERGRVPDGAPKKSSAEWLGTFCCTIPFGAASAFAQALCFSARARRWNHPIKPGFTAGL